MEITMLLSWLNARESEYRIVADNNKLLDSVKYVEYTAKADAMVEVQKYLKSLIN